jgi:Tol biopolymer transport system component
VETSDATEAHISIYDLAGSSAPRRLTYGGNNRFPVWSGDGRYVAFQSDRDGDRAVFRQAIDGGTAERLTKPEQGTSHVPDAWSPDGSTLLYTAQRGAAMTLWTLLLQDRTTARFDDVNSTVLPPDAAFSPDGRWPGLATAPSCSSCRGLPPSRL